MSGPQDLVCLGVIVGVRGLKGDLRIKSFTQNSAGLAAYGAVQTEDGSRTFDLRVIGEAKGVLIARASGIQDRTAAEALKGLKLYVAKDLLPEPEEDEYYHTDLLGLKAEGIGPQGSKQGVAEELGTIRAIYDFGAGDVLEITGGAYGTLMVPFTANAVPLVDIAGGRVVVDPPEGLFDSPEQDATGLPQTELPEKELGAEQLDESEN